MSRPVRNEKHAKGRPKRRAAKTHFFKYQLSEDPKKVEQNDLRRALQESLEEQSKSPSAKTDNRGKLKNGNRNRQSNDSNKTIGNSDSSNCNSSSSMNLGSRGSDNARKTRSGTMYPTKDTKYRQDQDQQSVKRAKIIADDHQKNNNTDHCDNKSKVIRTYSRNQPLNGPRSSTPIDVISDNSSKAIDSRTKASPATTSTISTPSKSATKPLYSTQGTQTSPPLTNGPNLAGIETKLTTATRNHERPQSKSQSPTLLPPKEQYLKPKRESKSDAYAKISAINLNLSLPYICNTSSFNTKKPSPSGSLTDNGHSSTKMSPKNNNSHSNSSTTSAKATPNSKQHQSSHTKTPSTSVVNSTKSCVDARQILIHKPTISITTEQRDNRLIVVARSDTQQSTLGLSAPESVSQQQQSSATTLDLNVVQRRAVPSSWSLLGVPEEKMVYLRNDEPAKRLICYPAIKHVEGDVIQVRDSVLLRSGAKKTDLPYIAKVCAFWQDATTGSIMMSLFWYYRPEHTEEGRKPHHLIDEIFASRHRDVDSVDCIEDKCYVLTFNEYCRYRKRCKMDQVKTSWSLADVTIPVSNEAYPRRNRIPDSDVNPELVFCCRQIYDSRMKRLIKNPLINPKYGHI